MQSVQAIPGDVHRMTRRAQSLGQKIPSNIVIFNDQNMHAHYITAVGPVFVGGIDCTMTDNPSQSLSSGVQTSGVHRMLDG